jgi:hypothetical protein
VIHAGHQQRARRDDELADLLREQLASFCATRREAGFTHATPDLLPSPDDGSSGIDRPTDESDHPTVFSIKEGS